MCTCAPSVARPLWRSPSSSVTSSYTQGKVLPVHVWGLLQAVLARLDLLNIPCACNVFKHKVYFNKRMSVQVGLCFWTRSWRSRLAQVVFCITGSCCVLYYRMCFVLRVAWRSQRQIAARLNVCSMSLQQVKGEWLEGLPVENEDQETKGGFIENRWNWWPGGFQDPRQQTSNFSWPWLI